jgi:hypothetical protein
MFQTTQPTRAAARSGQWLSLSVATLLLVGISVGARAQSSFDIGSVPRPDGAEVISDRASSSSVTYAYPASFDNTISATEKSLTAGGWMRYRTPDETSTRSSFRFKNGRVGIYVSFSMSGGMADRSRIDYRHNNSIAANVPFPEDATDIVYDENRPYLRTVTGLSIDAALEFFVRGLAADGWSQLAVPAIEARFPHAKFNTVENGQRVYFERNSRERQYPQSPVMLTLQRSADKTIIDIRIAPFALPQNLPLYKEFAGLPAPERTKTVGSTGSADSVRRESHALVIAELPVVLAFYRREMTLRGWQEQAAGASISDSAVRLTFTKPDDTAVLELGQRYDFTTVRLNAQVSQAAIAGRERAKKEADAKWMRDAVKEPQDLVAASEAKRLAQVAEAAGAPVESLRPLAGAATPVPMPENADEIKFDGNDGRLDFISPSTPKSVAAFYRDALRSQGWKEQRGVINGPTMYSIDFTKGAQKLDFTVMLFAGKAKVSARGSGLQVPADPNRETERLEAEETSGFPVPKKHSMTGQGTWTVKTGKVAFRREINAQVPSDIGSVLAFYRRELTARQWKESPDGAVVKSDQVMLAFAAPDGPAMLKLGRADKETTVNIAVKNPVEAEKAGILPPAGKAKVILSNFAEAEGSVSIGGKTYKVAPEPAKSDRPTGPILELKPGKYKYVMKLAGKPGDVGEVTLGADDSWALLIGPGGILSMHMY